MNKSLSGFLVSAILSVSAMPAAAQPCRQALLLGLDVSLSVNSLDFTLQREGLAKALVDPEIVDAIIGGSGHYVELAVYEWSGQFDQNVIVEWTAIDSRATLEMIAGFVAESPQDMRSGRTGLGAAMLFARDMLATRAHYANLTLDISGDGFNNNGIVPENVHDAMDIAGITVNALVIEPDAPTLQSVESGITDLSAYFEARVIVGPASFVESVVGFGDYADAIKRKMLRELVPMFVDSNDPVPRGRAGGPVRLSALGDVARLRSAKL